MVKKLIRALRLEEVSLMSGFFVIGGFFAIQEINAQSVLRIFLLGVLSFSVVLSVYSFNAASGIKSDKNNLRLKNLWHINARLYYLFAFGFFLVSIFCGLFLHKFIAIMAIIIIALWVLYSHPVIGLKQKAVYGTLIHFFGQIIHFNMAYLAFQNLSFESLFISIFFAIAFSTGHLLHEIIDMEADKQAGLKTSPILFGLNKTLNAIVILLLINLILLIALFIVGIISIAFYCFIIPAVMHLFLFFINKHKIEKMSLNIRNIYRIIYLLGGLVFCTLVLINIIN
jgi:lycopene elongase/hydratase (dihydrobisanhydrobacterioruberin-forming)